MSCFRLALLLHKTVAEIGEMEYEEYLGWVEFLTSETENQD